MKPFFLMLGFLTRLPVPHVDYEEATYRKGIKYFPLIGLVIGLILGGTALLGQMIGLGGMVPLLLVLMYIWVTGGIHLDGLADTCDGIFSGRDREGMLSIMKDSRIGTFGVLSLIIWFAFYMTAFPMIQVRWLFLMPVIGKSAMILSAYVASYARTEGLGKMFIEGCRKTELVLALVVPFVLALIVPLVWGLSFVDAPAIIAGIVCFLSVFGMTKSIQKKLGGITGDTLGFICETAQIIFLFVAVLLVNWPI